jgi:hypothetical protein
LFLKVFGGDFYVPKTSVLIFTVVLAMFLAVEIKLLYSK